jgi:hypothetical protein
LLASLLGWHLVRSRNDFRKQLVAEIVQMPPLLTGGLWTPTEPTRALWRVWHLCAWSELRGEVPRHHTERPHRRLHVHRPCRPRVALAFTLILLRAGRSNSRSGPGALEANLRSRRCLILLRKPTWPSKSARGRQVIIATLHQAGWRTPNANSEVNSASASDRLART